MTRFLQTIAIAIVMLFVLTIPFAFADEQCTSKSAHISRIQSDLDNLKKEPGWEETTYTLISSSAVPKIVLAILEERNLVLSYTITQPKAEATAHILWVTTKGKPNAYVILLDKEKCWIVDGPVPLGTWNRILSGAEQGA